MIDFLFIGSLIAISAVCYWRIQRHKRKLKEAVASLQKEVQATRDMRERFQRSESRLRSIYDGAEDVIFLVNRDYQFMHVNSRVSAFGSTYAQMVGKNVYEVLGVERGQYYADLYQKVFDTGKAIRMEDKDITHDGRIMWHSSILTPVFDDGQKVVQVLGITRDITELKEAEEKLRVAHDQAQAANLAKTNFLASLSHEIRTPIGIILGYSEILSLKETLDVEDREATEAILRNGRYLIGLIDDLLDVSRIESGNLKVDRTSTYLVEEIKAVIALMDLEARRKGLSLNLHLGESLPNLALIDPIRLRQILVNLLSNAIKYTREGDVTVAISVETEGHQEPWLRVSVKDTGLGIPDDKQVEIFEPFKSGPALRRGPSEQGIGLGLYLSRKLVRLMGGCLDLVCSEVGRGSEFVFKVPIEPVKEAVLPQKNNSNLVTEESKGPRGKALRLNGMKVMVVEDNLDNQMLISTLLGREGVHVDLVGDGLKAVDEGMSQEFDAILMDIQLPGISGLDATRELRNRGFTKPIIALTAFALKGERNRCLEAGCDAYLSKPIQRENLVSTLRQYHI